MLTDTDREHIHRTWRLVQQAALLETASKLFYDDLFLRNPAYREQFPEDISDQIVKLAKTLDFAVKALDWGRDDWKDGAVERDSDLFYMLMAMGRRHQRLYRVRNDQYGPVGASLLNALDLGLGHAFTPEVKAAWTKLYSMISQTMQLGALTLTPEERARAAAAQGAPS